MHQHTAVNADEAAGFPVDKAQIAGLAHGKAGVVAVAILPGRGQDGPDRGIVEPAHPFQGRHYLILLGGELGGIVQVLPLAAGTLPVVAAGRRHPVRGGFQQFHDPGGDILAADAHHFGHHPLAGDAAEYENISALMLGHSLAQASPR